MPRKIAVLFDNLGPYHIARLKACAGVMELLAIENRRVSADYLWDPISEAPFRRLTLNLHDSADGGPAAQHSLQSALDNFGPSAIAVPGWSSALAVTAIRWASERKVHVIIMSDSQESDFKRVFWKEDVKKRLLRFCHAALVGGRPHREYITQLGMPARSVFLGYDVVDNSYFSTESAKVRLHSEELREKLGLPKRYFLCSGRFIPKKNLLRLLQAFRRFRERCATGESGTDEWKLVLLGDGELRSDIEEAIRKLDLGPGVQLQGFRQIGELPIFYALARAFILPSTTEQWGLVVNEAMASGLPVLVSESCGCASDLVEEGKNGFTFNPFDIDEMADRMLEVATMGLEEREAMGKASQEIIARWSPETFASGLQAAALVDLASPARSVSVLDKFLLKLLSNR
jgi:glycosyltransferase involved in cell wall biosynthesis